MLSANILSIESNLIMNIIYWI